ncbi:MAG TPA: FKBP-type peptidyl-prolyl cis-trans isomerase [Candidatus Nanopelagicaceae bacterium]|nr:FKBP-type peptidyl-prolyl cis-trans isomerase [Candidatus Nanopelagicaceae bacterium]
MKRVATLIAGLTLLAGTSACSSQPEQAIVSAQASAQPSASTASLPTVSGPLNQAPTISKPTGTPPSTLQISDISMGTGAAVVSTSTVSVQYTGLSWSDGQTFDSSWQRGQPATFSLAQVIPGWQQGLVGMKVGGRRLVVIPPSLGYGASGQGPIKPNETLVFVVDLLAVK